MFLYNLHNHTTCEFHFHVQGSGRTFRNHVNSIITFAHCLYVYMPFNYPWSLLVTVWLLLVPTKITGISNGPTVLEGNNLQLICEASARPEPNITCVTIFHLNSLFNNATATTWQHGRNQNGGSDTTFFPTDPMGARGMT